MAKSGFKFNLLPPPPEVEVQLEAERDDSIFYAVLLVFFAVLIVLALVAADFFLVQPRLNEANIALTQTKQQIQNLDSVKRANGELFIKAQTVKPLLAKELKTADIFGVADKVKNSGQSAGVISYQRENSGMFVFEIVVADIQKVDMLVNALDELPHVEDLAIRNIRYDERGNLYLLSLAFTINANRS